MRSNPQVVPFFVLAVLVAGVEPGSLLAVQDSGGPETAPPSEMPRDPRARALFDESNALWTRPGRTEAEAERAADLMHQVTELEPDFVLGQVYLAQHDSWIFQTWDHSSERAQRARTASAAAVDLAPRRADTQGAMGTYLYRVEKEFEAALGYFRRAMELDPTDVVPVRMSGYVARRAGRWSEAVELLEAARDMAPSRSAEAELGNTYVWLERYDLARKAFERARALAPDHGQPRSALAWLDIHERGDRTALRTLLEERESGYVEFRWWLAMTDEDWVGALDALELEQEEEDPLVSQYSVLPRAMARGLAFRRMGDDDRAEAALREALDMLEPMLEAEPGDPRLHLATGTALALLGRADEAVARGRRGLDLWPRERDAMAGAYGLIQFLEIQALAGRVDDALATLEELLSEPFPWGRITMSMGPWLYRLHADPRFAAVLGAS
jgi:tetratricopeptide (TPR) repeat protein